jgi:hypothetical protein
MAEADELPGRIRGLSDLAVSGDHEEVEAQPIFAAPASGKEANRIRSGLFPRACFKLEDTVFAFDSSFPVFGQTFDAEKLKDLLEAHKGARLSIFGHADPSGDDDYNKVLSGRRAQAIHAMLLRDTAVWRELYVRHDVRGRDKWGLRSIQIMLNGVGVFEKEPESSNVRTDGEMDDATRAKLRSFQERKALPLTPFGAAPEHLVDAGTFAPLAERFMDLLCLTDASGNSLRLTPQDFLAQGEGRDGKGDLQGCSEFNPILVFSRQEDQEFQREKDHERRNRANRPNRRVMVLLFRAGSRIDPEKWPCPTVKEGVGACRKRFFRAVPGGTFQDGDVRRAPQAERREFENTRDTLACRFYDRMVSRGPCEIIALPANGAWEIDPVRGEDSTPDATPPGVPVTPNPDELLPGDPRAERMPDDSL